MHKVNANSDGDGPERSIVEPRKPVEEPMANDYIQPHFLHHGNCLFLANDGNRLYR